jgi:hypothetical protein
MRFLVTFENGMNVIANDCSYITIRTFEEMYNTKWLKTEFIY